MVSVRSCQNEAESSYRRAPGNVKRRAKCKCCVFWPAKSCLLQIKIQWHTCHQFNSISYWSNSEYWSQKHTQNGNIHSSKIRCLCWEAECINYALAYSPLTTCQNWYNTFLIFFCVAASHGCSLLFIVFCCTFFCIRCSEFVACMAKERKNTREGDLKWQASAVTARPCHFPTYLKFK